MTIHGTLLVDPAPDPIFDAVGRAVHAAVAVETWLNILAGSVAGLPFDQRPWAAVAEEVRAAVTQRLQDKDQGDADAVIVEGTYLLGLRNGLVHGVWNWGSTADGVPGFRTQRPPRGVDPFADDVAWTTVTWTRERLIDFANGCERVSASIQHNSSRWTEHLMADDQT
jgi:hypothetical protein